MCTATWLMTGDGYELFCNRDERRTRLPALPPTLQQRDGITFIAPRDANAGGSWIGVNESGLSLCLLNFYPHRAGSPTSPVSRGVLLTSLLDARSQTEVERRLRATPLAQFKAFMLLVLEPGKPVVAHTWDGAGLHSESDAQVPVTTSSFDTEHVIEHRREMFARVQGAAYHLSRDAGGDAYSVCMSRDDAQTVSFSHVVVTSGRIEFRYSPRDPVSDGFAEPIVVTRPRKNRRPSRFWCWLRLLLSRWRRLTRWEFWPLWAFYPPVVLYILWLALKHRSLALFTAANPAIPAGGFVGESKSEILRQLPEEFVARYELVDSPPASYPVVLKPDAGQRGLGVAVVHTRQEAEEYFQIKRGATIAQEYVPGCEFGVFYYRYPNEPRGHIFSITEKRFPSVTGDGQRTLEELILRDDRAVCMARFFLKKHADRLDSVPAAGDVVQLAELGTHCRGSVFKDGGWVKTPELEAVIDRISRGFTGFFVGRYDIRTPSVEDFKQGRNFKIIELNGVTSEATHIYQPGAGLLAGYRTLMRQWRITFEIAAQNHARGIAPVPAPELWRILRTYQPAAEV
jgi:hypothetical protein